MAIVEQQKVEVARAQPTLSEPALAGWWRRNASALFFMAPAALVVLIFFFIPVLLTVGSGLTDMSTATGLSKWQWVGFDNFERIFTSRFSGIVFWNTVFYVVVTLAFNVLVGLTVALLTVHLDRKTGGFFRAVWLLPRI